eukprot:m.314594 g.314594  ORF g.314594 m.314594 type:complete len:155 (+) comp23063_c0_seq12:273-737(+)
MSLIRMVLPSGDVNAQSGSNRANFTIPLAQPLLLRENDEYEVAMVQCTFPHPGNAFSVYINCSLCDYSRTGSGMSQLLFKAPPVASAMPYRVVQDSIPVWSKVGGKSFNAISVSLTYGANLPIPAAEFSENDYTTLELVIRRVSAAQQDALESA